MKIAVSAWTVLLFSAFATAQPNLRALAKNQDNGNNGNGKGDENNKNNPFKGKSLKQTLQVEGGKATKVKSPDVGIPASNKKGVKKMSAKEFAELDELPETGLYLLETDFVSDDVEKQLKELKLTLKEDGTLLNEDGSITTLFVSSEVFNIEKDTKDKEDEGGRRLAYPYPFSMYSWNFYWKYNGGFCRDYRAWSTAEAWGPLYSGYRPHTRIEYIETRVRMWGITDRDSCFNCDYESSYRKKDFGCFWPAIGGISGWHYANWKDGSFTATRTWYWT